MALLYGSRSSAAPRLICRGCQQLVAGRYLTALDAVWHPEHFVCGACSHPIDTGGFIAVDGVPYHPDCHATRFAPRCCFCSKPMAGSFSEDAWGRQFCAHHADEFPRCALCGRLADGKRLASRIAAAGQECAVCLETAVHELSRAQDSLRVVIAWAARLGMAVPVVPLGLCDRSTLVETSGEADPHRLGCTSIRKTVSSLGSIQTEILSINVLLDLPYVLFGSVLAHEIGHAWLHLSGVDGLGPVHEEGFCQFLAHLWLGQGSSPEHRFHARQIEQSEDSVYGAGFQVVTPADSRSWVSFGSCISDAR